MLMVGNPHQRIGAEPTDAGVAEWDRSTFFILPGESRRRVQKIVYPLPIVPEARILPTANSP
jgi:hypothetical protein